MREIALDTETTGLSFLDGDKITEIGCVEIIDKKITGKSFHVYVNPKREVSAKATEISGLTYDFLKKYKTFSQIYNDFLNFIGNDRLVIHNSKFDIGFLNFELNLVNEKPLEQERVIDTLSMAKSKYPGSPATLDALCRRFSVDSTMRTKHGALIDAELLAEVYIQMSVEILQKDIFGSIKKQKDINYNLDSNYKNIKNRSFYVNESESKAHEELLKKIKNPIWNNLEKIKKT